MKKIINNLNSALQQINKAESLSRKDEIINAKISLIKWEVVSLLEELQGES